MHTKAADSVGKGTFQPTSGLRVMACVVIGYGGPVIGIDILSERVLGAEKRHAAT